MYQVDDEVDAKQDATCYVPDSWVTRLPCDAVEIDGQQQRLASHSCRRKRRLAARVPSPHHNHIVMFFFQFPVTALRADRALEGRLARHLRADPPIISRSSITRLAAAQTNPGRAVHCNPTETIIM
eukprot:1190079-Prorocentrum_minimum.AAC.3